MSKTKKDKLKELMKKLKQTKKSLMELKKKKLSAGNNSNIKINIGDKIKPSDYTILSTNKKSVRRRKKGVTSNNAPRNITHAVGGTHVIREPAKYIEAPQVNKISPQSKSKSLAIVDGPGNEDSQKYRNAIFRLIEEQTKSSSSSSEPIITDITNDDDDDNANGNSSGVNVKSRAKSRARYRIVSEKDGLKLYKGTSKKPTNWNIALKKKDAEFVNELGHNINATEAEQIYDESVNKGNSHAMNQPDPDPFEDMPDLEDIPDKNVTIRKKKKTFIPEPYDDFDTANEGSDEAFDKYNLNNETMLPVKPPKPQKKNDIQFGDDDEEQTMEERQAFADNFNRTVHFG
jgi:hypothetical protein